MNLRQIELLRAVVRCETTVRAARELGLSQPAVSVGEVAGGLAEGMTHAPIAGICPGNGSAE
jgi:regulatory helix-turn-helix LysR family protein